MGKFCQRLGIVMNQMIKKTITSIVILLCCSFPVYAWQLKPFETTYTAVISNVPFDGQATYSLTKKGNEWAFKTLAAMAIAQREENSVFVIKDGHLQPSLYEFNQSGLKTKQVILTFDWKKMFAKGHFKDKKHDDDMFFDLKYKMLDPLSTQLALQMDVAAGKKQMSYKVIEDDEIDTYQFKVIGSEVIDTPVGKLATIKVQRVRGANSKRQSYIWFAKDWNYTVVKLYHLEKNGQEYVISLSQGTVDHKEITGKK